MRMVREPLGFPTSWTTSTNKRPPKTWLGRPPCEANLGDLTHNNRYPIQAAVRLVWPMSAQEEDLYRTPRCALWIKAPAQERPTHFHRSVGLLSM